MVQIYFADLTISKMGNNSGVFTGENHLQGRLYRGKMNEGFGNVSGQRNQLVWNRQIVIDVDVVDQYRENKRKESG